MRRFTPISPDADARACSARRRRHALVQAILSLRRRALARGRSRPAAAAAERQDGRNFDWPHLFNGDVLSMPDKWEYPWYAAWDLAFHCVASR